MIIISPTWQSTYPGAALGILAMGDVANPTLHPQLDQARLALEDQLRTRYTGLDRAAIETSPEMQAYRAYYKGFKKTYHVLLQLESIAFKAKSIPNVAALVEAMFMAELNHQLLTAGHDLDRIQPPIRLEIARGDERYTLLRGEDQVCKPGDMVMADAQAVMCSVIYGSDFRTRITPATRRVLFVVYAPPGIALDRIEHHLDDLEANVRLVSTGAEVEHRRIYR